MTLSVAHESPRDTSLTDFFYIDRARMALFAAQMFDDGVLTSTKTTSTVGSQSAGKFGGEIPLILKGEVTSADSTNSGIERHFDAAWSMSLNLIRELQARDFIHRDLGSAALGQIVLFRGNIQVLDYRLLKNLWEPLLAQQRSLMPEHTQAQKQAKKTTAETQKIHTRLIENLPHLLQLKVFNETQQLWGTLDPESMVSDVNDLAFKYGPAIPGEWMVLAVLDAKPFDENEDMKLPPGVGEVELGLLQMAIQLKTLFGRNAISYGMTPLAIYRQVMPGIQSTET